MPNFYSVIIGTELLNGRRKDKHFEFVSSELLKRGWSLKANFVLKDDPEFLEDVFRLIKSDKNSGSSFNTKLAFKLQPLFKSSLLKNSKCLSFRLPFSSSVPIITE